MFGAWRGQTLTYRRNRALETIKGLLAEDSAIKVHVRQVLQSFWLRSFLYNQARWSGFEYLHINTKGSRHALRHTMFILDQRNQSRSCLQTLICIRACSMGF